MRDLLKRSNSAGWPGQSPTNGQSPTKGSQEEKPARPTLLDSVGDDPSKRESEPPSVASQTQRSGIEETTPFVPR